MTQVSQLRPSPIAGLWYEGDPLQLAQQIDSYLDQADFPIIQGEVVAVIAPHAGHKYSGRTAGYAFKSIFGRQIDLVAVVSPMHQYHPAALITSAHRGYDTPLGPVWIDQEAVLQVSKNLKDEYNLDLVATANDREHSLEIELPFLQRALQPGFKLLPIMVRSQSSNILYPLSRVLAGALRSRNALLVASSDLSHFYPLSAAKQLDTEMLSQIAKFSPQGVLQTEKAGRGFACGAGAIAAVLWAAQELGANQVEILHHSTSGEETGEFDSVVGYGAAVILKKIQ